VVIVLVDDWRQRLNVVAIVMAVERRAGEHTHMHVHTHMPNEVTQAALRGAQGELRWTSVSVGFSAVVK